MATRPMVRMLGRFVNSARRLRGFFAPAMPASLAGLAGRGVLVNEDAFARALENPDASGLDGRQGARHHPADPTDQSAGVGILDLLRDDLHAKRLAASAQDSRAGAAELDERRCAAGCATIFPVEPALECEKIIFPDVEDVFVER